MQRFVSANSKHSSRTGQRPQIALASAIDSPLVGKKIACDSSDPRPRHAACRCQVSSDSSGKSPLSVVDGTTLTAFASSPRKIRLLATEEVIVRSRGCGSLEPKRVDRGPSCPQALH